MNRNHTHTGNCQACGREHAVDIKKGTIAKHGYTVDWNSFLGVCPGADRSPAQVTVEYTRVIITRCTEAAISYDEHADMLIAGTARPLMCVHFDATIEWTNKYGTKRTGKNVEIAFDLGTADEQKNTLSNAINEDRHNAAGNREHAKFLTSFVLPMYGTALHSVEQAAVRHAAERAEREAKPTKASFKRQLERIGRDYDKARDVIHTALLAMDRDTRSAAWELAYDMPYSLNHFRDKHGKAIVAVLGDVFRVNVVEVELMVEARERVQAAKKKAGL